MGLLIRNGTVVNSTGAARGDVYCDNGTVTAVGTDLSALKQPGDSEVDASGKLVLPGAIDAHTHMELPFMGTVSVDDFEHGTVAALAGGTTTIIDFAIPTKGQPLLEALGLWREKAAKAVGDYAFHMAVTDWNRGIEAEIPEVVEKHGISSFKTFTAYKGAIGINDEELFNCMLSVQAAGGIVTCHTVNGDVLLVLARKFLAEGKTGPIWHVRSQPPEAAGEAAGRVIHLASIAGVPLYIVHNSCDDALDEIKAARAAGKEVYGETCTQYLLLDESLCEPEAEGAKWVLSPPLRTKVDQEALWQGLRDGYIQTIATDHCVFHYEGQKSMGRGDFTKIPNGLGGVEERLALIYSEGVRSGRLSLSRWVDACCTKPAQLFGLYPRKGAIEPGADADIVIFDPTVEWTCTAANQWSKCDYNPYEGRPVVGKVEKTFLRGRLVIDGRDCKGQRGDGQYLHRPRFQRVM